MKILAIATALTALVAAQTDNGDAIRDRLDKYLFAYEPQLSSVVAEERMTQRDGASDDYDQARLLLSERARHNLGGARTTNLPNLPLEFLHPRNRHRLHHRLFGMEKIRGVNTARMVFE